MSDHVAPHPNVDTHKAWADFKRTGRKQFDRATRHLLPGEEIVDAWEGAIVGDKVADTVFGVPVVTNKRVITAGSAMLVRKGGQVMLSEVVSANTGQNLLGGVKQVAPSVTISSRAGESLQFTPQTRRDDRARTEVGYVSAVDGNPLHVRLIRERSTSRPVCDAESVKRG